MMNITTWLMKENTVFSLFILTTQFVVSSREKSQKNKIETLVQTVYLSVHHKVWFKS